VNQTLSNTLTHEQSVNHVANSPCLWPAGTGVARLPGFTSDPQAESTRRAEATLVPAFLSARAISVVGGSSRAARPVARPAVA
jgi:hypothetical protein